MIARFLCLRAFWSKFRLHFPELPVRRLVLVEISTKITNITLCFASFWVIFQQKHSRCPPNKKTPQALPHLVPDIRLAAAGASGGFFAAVPCQEWLAGPPQIVQFSRW